MGSTTKHRILTLVLTLFHAILAAQQLPLFAEWKSLNKMYYDSAQKGKQISWDEHYRAQFGLREMYHKGIVLDLTLETEQFFDESVIRLQTLRIGGKVAHAWVLTAGSYLHGFGSDFYMDDQPALVNGYKDFNYQQMRMNSLSISYLPDAFLSDITLDLGGNTHNQLTALVSAHHYSDVLKMGISQEFRTFDNHWRSPVFISGLDLELTFHRFTMKTSSAVSVFPDYGSTMEHQEVFAQTELCWQLSSKTKLALGALRKDTHFAPKNTQRYQVRLEHDYGNKFSVKPLTEYNRINADGFWTHGMNLVYHALPLCDLGVYYDYSHFDAKPGRHGMGISLVFGFDPAS